MKTSSHTCAECGAALAEDTPRGLCPQCLLKGGLVSASTMTSPAFLSNTTTVSDSDSSAAIRVRNQVTKVHYFGDYELLEEIARGGMGIVYKARQVSLNRIVAVKTILGGHLASEADIRRFRLEAEAAANLQHPNIVAIHEVGENAGEHYFSMDYIDGVNLSQHTQGRPMPAQDGAKMVQTLAETVHFAHQRGTLHRDLKPQNILIDGSGRPRITDFGLAKLAERESELTRSGAAMGSPSYMPPEQAAGRLDQVGPASDVYALGAILYELLTGQAPFRGESSLATMQQVINDEPMAPTQLHANIPKDLETICLKCLEKRPEKRYHSALALAEELGRFLHHESILARPAGRLRKAWNWSQRHPWILTGVAAGTIVVLFCVAWAFWDRTRYLKWQEMNPGQLPPMECNFLMLTSALCFWVVICIHAWANTKFRKQFRLSQEGGPPLTGMQLLNYGALGAMMMIYAICYSLNIAHMWAWGWKDQKLLIGLCVQAGFPAWLGAYMLWRAVGAHESATFRHLVEKRFALPSRKEERPLSRTRRWLGLLFQITVLALFAHLAARGCTARWSLVRCQDLFAAPGTRPEWGMTFINNPPAELNFAKIPSLNAIAYNPPANSQLWLKLKSREEALGTGWILPWHGEITDLARIQNYWRLASKSSGPKSLDPVQEIFSAMQAIEPQLQEIRSATQRPFAQLDPSLPQDWFSGSRGLNLQAWNVLAHLFTLHASAALVSGQADLAAGDFFALMRFAALLNSRVGFDESNMRNNVVASAIQILWEGWLSRRWTASHLAQFQTALSSTDLLRDFDNHLRFGERIRSNAIMEKEIGIVMVGGVMPFFLEGQLLYNRMLYDFINASYSTSQQRIFPSKMHEQTRISNWKMAQYSIFARALTGFLPKVDQGLPRTARAQTYVNLATLVCALERFWADRQRYPEQLDDLLPEYLPKGIPRDLMTGQPMKYRRDQNDKNHFSLYSVGWDEKDDGGKVSENEAPGDWIWHKAPHKPSLLQ